MPKCSRCGSYYIRPPCPVCSPPGTSNQIIVDSEDEKGKTIQELQQELEEILEKVGKRKFELDNKSQDLATQLELVRGRINDLELTKVSSKEKIASLEKQLSVLNGEIANLESERRALVDEKASLDTEIQSSEDEVNQMEREVFLLRKQMESRQQAQVESAQQNEEENRPHVENRSDSSIETPREPSEES
ncbi:MAG: hypothetical protein ACFFE8_00800 [Candidatus Heimdallarchaeota archaeon]